MNQEKVEFRSAIESDLEELIALLADDALGKQREVADLDTYLDAFNEITADPNEEIIVAVSEGKIVGTVQISVIRNLSRSGARRAQLESVRVASSYRGKGLGKRMISYAIEIAKSKDCKIVQLTSDKTRTDALAFYSSLGFQASHEGFKLIL